MFGPVLKPVLKTGLILNQTPNWTDIPNFTNRWGFDTGGGPPLHLNTHSANSYFKLINPELHQSCV